MLSSSFLRLCLCFALLLVNLPALAVTVNAVGQAAIVNGDIDNARAAAIEDARQAASLQAAAYISASQQVENGIITSDSVDIRSMSNLYNMRIVSEKVRSGIIHVQISAEVDTSTGACSNHVDPTLKKTVAFTLFRLENREQANQGRLSNIQTDMPTLITEALRNSPIIQPFNASRIDIVGTDVTAPTHHLPDGMLTNTIENTEPMSSQFIVAGIIRDLAMNEPKGPREKNILQDWYDRADYASHKHRRTLALDIYLYDGISGSLINTKHYSTEGFWRRPDEEHTGFGTPRFWGEDFGAKVKTLMGTIERDLADEIRCEPLSARITDVHDKQVWINAGSERGLNIGDKLQVLRRFTHYDDQLRSLSEFNNTGLTLTLDHVEAAFARGVMNEDSATYNINRDDIVRADGGQ